MANDYKRMWTKEEIKSNSVLELPDIPEVVDANSPDIIRVQGKLYYKDTSDNSNNLTGSTWVFKNDIPNIYYGATYNIHFTSNNKNFTRIRFAYQGVTVIYFSDISGSEITVARGTWKMPEYQTITITGGSDVENINLINNLMLVASTLNNKKQYSYKELGADEELVKSIPTAVSIIEDQGKLELMLEHDGNVLEVNDTPNQFLQRRLDKPSAEWNNETSPEDFATWWNEVKNTLYKGQIVFLNYGDGQGYYLYNGNYNSEPSFTPLNVQINSVLFEEQSLIYLLNVGYEINVHSIYVGTGVLGNTQLSFNEMLEVKLF